MVGHFGRLSPVTFHSSLYQYSRFKPNNLTPPSVLLLRQHQKHMVKEELMACLFLNFLFISLNYTIQRVTWF